MLCLFFVGPGVMWCLFVVAAFCEYLAMRELLRLVFRCVFVRILGDEWPVVLEWCLVFWLCGVWGFSGRGVGLGCFDLVVDLY